MLGAPAHPNLSANLVSLTCSKLDFVNLRARQRLTVRAKVAAMYRDAGPSSPASSAQARGVAPPPDHDHRQQLLQKLSSSHLPQPHPCPQPSRFLVLLDTSGGPRQSPLTTTALIAEPRFYNLVDSSAPAAFACSLHGPSLPKIMVAQALLQAGCCGGHGGGAPPAPAAPLGPPGANLAF